MTSEGRRSTPIHAAAALIALLAALSLPAGALAASAPAVQTGPAQQVNATTAVLTGTINPEGQSTSYFFQLGASRSYGATTPTANAGSGGQAVAIAVPVSLLHALTHYHFRLVALNATGAGTGADMSFVTTAIPLTLAILGEPNPLIFGSSMSVRGALSGTGNAGRPVALQANPFPYIQGFTTLGNALLTDAAGNFDFPVLNVTAATEYRVLTTTPPVVVSPVLLEGVAVRLSVQFRHTARPHFVRIFGTVTPAEDGMGVAIFKLLPHGRRVLVAGTNLRHSSAESSRFSRVLHATRGKYQVFVKVNDGAHGSAYSAPLRIG